MLSDGQRAGFRHFLGDQHYDTANEDLMLNEAQTYLVNTNDKRYFLPDYAGLTRGRGHADARDLRARHAEWMAQGRGRS
jgi:hypothetical protein